ncbi:MAG: ribbon-helix-helix protein, CopG family [Melioribacteraceae bacterium]|nr:ribbon-helix-helix protein, CopG family [Melioribacteraceae bacterium]MCF8353619.1 ribbon-helix-helix protein, CopG family [Melioribacteraceae bacterium]MCF8393389.1 ribbon-helix-helix protein, CopG family [Melioribacteraceae bacterium]MCF8419246.1 ribbon-helix-helix protein, CopG family [Melioribacteraceae bacterium]
MLKPSKRRSEKEKIGTVLEKEVIKKIKKLALDEGRGISDIIQDAVLNYEKAGKSKLITRKEAVNRFCSKPFKISQKEAEKLLNEDYYEA